MKNGTMFRLFSHEWRILQRAVLFNRKQVVDPRLATLVQLVLVLDPPTGWLVHIGGSRSDRLYSLCSREDSISRNYLSTELKICYGMTTTTLPYQIMRILIKCNFFCLTIILLIYSLHGVRCTYINCDRWWLCREAAAWHTFTFLGLLSKNLCCLSLARTLLATVASPSISRPCPRPRRLHETIRERSVIQRYFHAMMINTTNSELYSRSPCHTALHTYTTFLK